MQITWAGECSAWECDELGHMNMRYYLYKVAQARAMLFLRMGLGEIRAHPTALHIRYLGEARPGDPLSMQSGVISQNAGECTLLHMLYHADERLAATIIETLSLPANLPRLSAGWTTQALAISKARGFDETRILSGMDRDSALAAGFLHLGCGVFRPDEAGSDGRVRAEAMMGRITETVGHFQAAWPENYEAETRGRISGVLLEAQLAFHARARPGQGYDFFSGIIAVSGKIRTLRHVIVDAASGAPLMSMIGVGGLLDLEARKLRDPSPSAIAALEALIITP